jgi:UDP-3-O-[3-hydroxymyristoyl] N-acetylglucosamine deacetylase/3-hydroxyacyl-[acyl-carrier-protein] dehydratase
MSDARWTVARPATVEGVGLHLGVRCRLTFHPAPVGEGVTFVRSDLAGAPRVAARVEHAVLTERRTQLGLGDASLHTVEHVLAAVAGRGVDDVVIEMDGPEPPILDGSAAPFVDALNAAGVVAHGGHVD